MEITFESQAPGNTKSLKLQGKCFRPLEAGLEDESLLVSGLSVIIITLLLGEMEGLVDFIPICLFSLGLS